MVEPIKPPAQEAQEFLASQNNPNSILSTAVNANPNLQYNPKVLAPLASVQGVNGHTLGLATHALNTVGHLVNTFSSHPSDNANDYHLALGTPHLNQAVTSAHNPAQSLKANTNSGSSGFFGGLFHNIAHDFDKVRHFGASAWNGAAETTNGMGNQIGDFLNRYSLSAEELLGLHGTSGYGDLGSTIGNLIASPVDALVGGTPLGRPDHENLFFGLRHIISNFISTEKTKGYGTAIGQIIPLIAAAIITKHVTIGGVAPEIALRDAATVETGNAAVSAGTELTSQQAADLAAARTRMAERAAAHEKSAEEDATLSNVRENLRGLRGKAYDFTNRVKSIKDIPISPSTPFRLIGKMLHVVSSPGQNITSNIMYAIQQRVAEADPNTKALWDATQNGDIIGRDGKSVNFGKGFAEFLGQHQGEFWGDTLSGSANFWGTWLSGDPIGAAGDVAKLSRTTEGATGLIGKFFSGTGIYSSADLGRILNQYGKARRMVSWLATHSAGQIADRMRGMFTPEQALELGKAASEQEVQQILGKYADAHSLVKTTMPMMTLGDLARANIRDGKVLGIGLAGEGGLFSKGVKTVRENYKTVVDETGLDPRPTDPSEALSKNPDELFDTKKARWLHMFFNKNPLWRNPITLEQETATINVDDPAPSISGIIDFLKNNGVTRAARDQITSDLLAAARNPSESKRIGLNAVEMIVNSHVYAGLDKNVFSPQRTLISALNKTGVSKLTGDMTGGLTTVEVAGRNHGDYSTVYETPSDGYAEDFGAKNAATGYTDLSNWKLPKPYQIRGLATQIRDAVIKAIPDSVITVNNLLQMTNDDIAQLAEYSRGSLAENATSRASLNKLGDILDTKLLSKEFVGKAESHGFKKAAEDGYFAAKEELKKIVEDAVTKIEKDWADGTISRAKPVSKESEITATVMDAVRSKYRELQALVDIGKERNFHTATNRGILDPDKAKELEAKMPKTSLVRSLRDLRPENVTHIEARFQAYRDAVNEIYNKMNTSVYSEKELRDHAIEMLGTVKGIKIVSQDMIDKYIEQTRKIQTSNLSVSSFHTVNNWLSSFMNKSWNRLALLSGNWGFHIFGSEGALATARFGKQRWMEGTLINSIEKHMHPDVTDRLLPKIRASFDERARTKSTLPSEFVSNKYINNEIHHMAKAVSAALYGVDKIITAARDVAGGSMLGFQDAALKSMLSEENYQNLLDDTVALYDSTGGHLPNIIEGIDGGILANEGLSREASKLTIGMTGRGWTVSHMYPTKDFVPMSMDSHGESIATGLNQGLWRMHSDPLKMSVVNKLYDFVLQRTREKMEKEFGPLDDLKKLIDSLLINPDAEREQIQRMSRTFTHRQLEDELIPKMLTEIENIPAGKKDLFERSTARLSSSVRAKLKSRYGFDSAASDHAAALVNDVLGYMTPNSAKEYLHTDLLWKLQHGEIGNAFSTMKDLNAMPEGTHPVNIPARQMSPYRDMGGALKSASRMSWLDKASDWTFQHILGHWMNTMVREPSMVIENHLAMNNYRDLVERGILPESQARANAMFDASISMSRFIHNPLDKTQFEANMRVAMPFYFAQNQAWRRAGRLLKDDFGAAEKYAKAMYGITNYVYLHKKELKKMTAWVPGSQLLIDPLINIFGIPTKAFQGVSGFGINDVLNSVGSMDPFGNDSTLGGVVSTVAHAGFGPMVELPLEGISGIFGALHWQSGVDFLKAIDPNLQYGVLSTVQPNKALGSLLSIVGIGQHQQATTMSMTMSAFKSKWQQEINAQVAKFKADGTFDGQLLNIPKSQQNGFLIAQAGYALNQKFSDDLQKQQFVTDVHGVGIGMAILQAAVDILFPGSGQITNKSDLQTPLYQAFNAKLMKEKNPDGTNKYSSMEIMNQWLEKNPGYLLYTIPKTFQTGSWYPDTQKFIDFATQHPEMLKQYPNGSSYLLSPDGKFSLPAVSLQIQFGLREQNSPETFAKSMMVTMGKLYVNDVIDTDPQYADYKTNYSANQQRKAAIANYASTNIPFQTYMHYTDTNFHGAQAIDDLGQMISDSNVPDAVFGGKDVRSGWNKLINAYTDKTNQILEFGLNSKSSWSIVRTPWMDECKNAQIGQNILYTDPMTNDTNVFTFQNAQQVNFAKTVLAYFPTIPAPS